MSSGLVNHITVDTKLKDPSDHHNHTGHDPPWFTWSHGLYVGLLGACSLGQRSRRAKANRRNCHSRQFMGSQSDKHSDGGNHQQTLVHWRTGVRQALHKLIETYSPDNPFLGQYKQDGQRRRTCRSRLRPAGQSKLGTVHIACLCTVWIAFLAPLGTQVAPLQIATISDKFAPASALAAVSICCQTSTAGLLQTGIHQTQPEQAHSNSVHKWHLDHSCLMPYYSRKYRISQEEKITRSEQRSGHSLTEATTTHSNIGNRHRLPTAHIYRAQSQPGPKSGTGAIKVMIIASILPGSCGVRVPGVSTPSGRPSPQTHISQYFVGKRVEGASVQTASRAAHGSFSAKSILATNRRAQPRRGGKQPRFRIFTLNVGGLSAFMWADLKAFISGPGLYYGKRQRVDKPFLS